jgi:Replication protein
VSLLRNQPHSVNAPSASASVHTEETSVVELNVAPPAPPPMRWGAEHAFRHSGWTKLRERVYRAMSYYACLSDRAAMDDPTPGSRKRNTIFVSRNRVKAFERCGSDAWVLQSLDDPNRYKVTCNACRDRFCTPCSNERASHLRAKILGIIQGKQYRFVTFTLRTENEPLQAQLNRLYASFRKLRQRAFWKQRVEGGIAFCEVKWSERANRWHPHLHVLVHGRYIPQKELGQEWYQVTGDSWIVDVRAVKDDKKAADYVGKYATKGFHSSAVETDERLHEAMRCFFGRRFVIPFGDWKGFDPEDEPEKKGWRIIESLHVLLSRVRNGDPNACRILDSIVHVVSEELQEFVRPNENRGPPVLTYTEQQAALWGDIPPTPPHRNALAWATR